MSGMNLWVVDVEKRLGEEYWTNVYHLNAPSLADAEVAALAIVGRERSMHRDNVSFTKVRVRPKLLPAGGGTVVATGGTGQLSSTGQNILPLFNVARVDFLTSVGRPSRKYFRLPIVANDAVNGTLNATITGIINTYAAGMVGDARFVDPQGQPFIGSFVDTRVAMRQLRRGAKRKLPVV